MLFLGFRSVPPHKSERLTQMTQLVPEGTFFSWHCGLCWECLHTAKKQVFSLGSFLYVNYEREQPLLCPLGSTKTQVTSNWWDTQERVLGLGAEIVSHSLNRNFWAARMGAEDFHPLYVWQHLQFFSKLEFFWGGLAASLWQTWELSLSAGFWSGCEFQTEQMLL